MSSALGLGVPVKGVATGCHTHQLDVFQVAPSTIHGT